MYTIVFNANYNCNDDCSFCFNKRLLNKTPHMSLEEVERNYLYITENFPISSIIISGWEPSLHPDFWRLMVFFYYKIHPSIRPALNTNGIVFSQEKLMRKLEKLIRLSPLPRKQISLSFSNIWDPENPKNKKEELKIAWIRNILASDLWNTRIFLSVIITKDNYKNLSNISRYIQSSINPVRKDFLHMDIRYVFIWNRKRAKNMDDVFLEESRYKDVLPDSFAETKRYIEDFIRELHGFWISISLKNLPICSFSKDIQHIRFSAYKWEKRLWVSSFSQFEKIDIASDYFNEERTMATTHDACRNCVKNTECAIEKEYMLLDVFDTFSTIYDEETRIV